MWEVFLIETQTTGIPIWRKEYNVKEAFNLTSLYPEDYAMLVERMKSNVTVGAQYYHYKYKSTMPLDVCDEKCVASEIEAIQMFL